MRVRLYVSMAATCCVLAGPGLITSATAQDVPAEYQAVLKTLNRSGDFKANVLKVKSRART